MKTEEIVISKVSMKMSLQIEIILVLSYYLIGMVVSDCSAKCRFLTEIFVYSRVWMRQLCDIPVGYRLPTVGKVLYPGY